MDPYASPQTTDWAEPREDPNSPRARTWRWILRLSLAYLGLPVVAIVASLALGLPVQGPSPIFGLLFVAETVLIVALSFLGYRLQVACGRQRYGLLLALVGPLSGGTLLLLLLYWGPTELEELDPKGAEERAGEEHSGA